MHVILLINHYNKLNIVFFTRPCWRMKFMSSKVVMSSWFIANLKFQSMDHCFFCFSNSLKCGRHAKKAMFLICLQLLPPKITDYQMNPYGVIVLYLYVQSDKVVFPRILLCRQFLLWLNFSFKISVSLYFCISFLSFSFYLLCVLF